MPQNYRKLAGPHSLGVTSVSIPSYVIAYDYFLWMHPLSHTHQIGQLTTQNLGLVKSEAEHAPLINSRLNHRTKITSVLSAPWTQTGQFSVLIAILLCFNALKRCSMSNYDLLESLSPQLVDFLYLIWVLCA